MNLKSLRRKINFFSTTVEKLGHTEAAFELKLEQLTLNFCYENKCKIAIRSYYKFLLNVLLYEEETATIYNSSIFEEVPMFILKMCIFYQFEQIIQNALGL